MNMNYVTGTKAANVILTPMAEHLRTFQALSSPLQPSAHTQVVTGEALKMRWVTDHHRCTSIPSFKSLSDMN
jgi:hypothetical protein